MTTITNGDARPALSAELLASAKSAIATAVRSTFHPDPLLGPGLSHTISVIGSAVKRHGHLLEQGICEALEHSDRFIVETNVVMPITLASESLVAGNSPGALSTLSIASDTESRQVAHLDLIAVDVDKAKAFILEIKRGSGATELKKRKQTERLLLAAKLQGKSFLRTLGYEVESVEAFVVDWCGRSAFPPSLTVTREGVDALFGVPVTATVEAMTGVMRRELRDALPRLLELARTQDVLLGETGFETPIRA